jgi:hypothetical protein
VPREEEEEEEEEEESMRYIPMSRLNFSCSK